ncbi:MAG TPA: bifunctional oligoribonuclease/PAP phosphatase NrnA [Desulfomonilaceae bacterium]|nr:bifunctional oligoribonuclease/PAP phosphatase NrnA [Desulfomonilaceae bacterium]
MNAEAIAHILKTEDRFVIVTHVNPDGDAVGSLLGMYLALTEMGKSARPLSNDRPPDLYSFLPGFEHIVTDAARLPWLPDWIVCLDVAERSRISGNISSLLDRSKIINIDHHPTNPGFGDVNFVQPTATSTAELVHRILKEMGYRTSAHVGKCLYTGLITDTGCFRFAGVNSETLKIAAEMLSPGIDSYEVTRPLFEEYPLNRLQLENLMLERIEILLEGKLLISTLYEEDFQRLSASMADTENLVNRLRESRGVRAGVLLTQMSDNLIRASFRSKDLDVASIAKALGGGGHRNAAGLKIRMSLAELKEKIVREIERSLTTN